MTVRFESQLNDYQGTVEVAEIWEDSPVLTTNIITTEKLWGVHMKWTMSGWEARQGHEEWHIQLFLEKIGLGKEYTLPNAGPVVINNRDGAWDPATQKRVFDRIIEIDPVTDPVDPGTYRLTATLQYFVKGTNEPKPCAGFYEGEILQFYKPES